MSTYILSAYLVLLGVTELVTTQVPVWVVGLLALAAGVVLAVEKLTGKGK